MDRLPWLAPLPLALFLFAAGCEPEPRNAGGPSATPAKVRDVVGVDVPGSDDQPAPKPKKAEDAFIVGKTTQDVRNAAPELQKGARVANSKITAKDPITLPGNAYVTIIGRNSVLNIQHALDLYQAENGSYPKDHAEFMEKIIKANNIALPQLPHYQKYSYDEKEHKLIILQYDDLK